jgi:photosystem II S4 domain protein
MAASSFARYTIPTRFGWQIRSANSASTRTTPFAAHHRHPQRSSSSSTTTTTAAASNNAVAASTSQQSQQQQYLAGVAPENREDVAQLLELAERAGRGWSVVWSRFVTPPVAADALAAIAKLADVAAVPWGGYGGAERCRIAFGREELLGSAAAAVAAGGVIVTGEGGRHAGCDAGIVLLDTPAGIFDDSPGVAALDISGNFMFDPATHRDFLGALVGTGVTRDVVGDILVQGERGAQALVDVELVEHFETELTRVRTVPVTVKRIDLSELRVPPVRSQDISSVEASLRLDAVASAGFRVGRSAMADLIRGGDVRLNWREATKPSVLVKEGDVVAVAGKGRLKVRGVSVTKKDKYLVSMTRLL